LESRKTRGEIADWKFEPVTFNLPGGIRYKVDFLIRYHDNRCEWIEIKGRHIWEKDKIRFKVASEVWGFLGEFQMVQKVRGEFIRIR
jgi:hypothetical protein